MIPYEELVIALQTWRAKQGLPIAQMSGQITPPAMATAPAAAPPAPPRPPQPTPPPLEAHEPGEDSLDVDGALIEEAHYENEGDDFAMAFGSAGAGDGDDSTSIGSAPRPSDSTLDEGGTEVASPGARRGGNRGDQW